MKQNSLRHLFRFFVLSGYLMAMILSRHRSVTLAIVRQFYIRRVRRIVPIYLVVICCTLPAGMLLLFHSDIDQLSHDTLPAVGFCSNMMSMFEKWEYFDQVVKYRLFLHTWSLSVEMQFYLFVPLLFAALLRFRRLANPLCLALFVYSFILQYSSRQAVAFGFLFCRIWQFMAGIMTHSATHYVEARLTKSADTSLKQEDEAERDDAGHVEGQAEPGSLSDASTRLIVVALTSVLLVAGVAHQSFLLGNLVAVWIGDISYVVYLVHWPIFQFYKYWSIEKEFTLREGALLISLSFLVAFVLDEYVDSRFRAQSSTISLVKTLVSLYVVVVVLYMTLPVFQDRISGLSAAHTKNLRALVDALNDDVEGQRLAPMLTMESKISLNHYLTGWNRDKLDCDNKTALFGPMTNNSHPFLWECHFKGTGQKKVMLIGNSHAKQIMHGVVKAFEDHASELHMFATHGRRCAEYPNSTIEAVRLLKPDILVVVFKYIQVNRPVQGEMKDDYIFKSLQSYIDRLKPNAKLILLGDPNVEFEFDGGPVIAKRLWQRLPIDNIAVPASKFANDNVHTMKRLNALNCTQCRRIDFAKEFCDRSAHKCFPYDRSSQVSYFLDTHHMNLMGALKVAPQLRLLAGLNATKLS
ncbi:Protein OAC-19 [Aphelenchoides avenae]|nr:Protein OAC-19 [Aphelenchus avenae]